MTRRGINLEKSPRRIRAARWPTGGGRWPSTILDGGRQAKRNSDGLNLLEKAKALHAETSRERAYISTLMAFYRDYDKLDDTKRAATYSEASRQLHERFPE